MVVPEEKAVEEAVAVAEEPAQEPKEEAVEASKRRKYIYVLIWFPFGLQLIMNCAIWVL